MQLKIFDMAWHLKSAKAFRSPVWSPGLDQPADRSQWWFVVSPPHEERLGWTSAGHSSLGRWGEGEKGDDREEEREEWQAGEEGREGRRGSA